MDLSALAPAVGALVSAIVGSTGMLRGPGRRRDRIKADAKIASLLPASDGRTRLLRHLDDQVQQLIEDETTKTRDLPMFVVSIIVLPALSGATIWLFQLALWWTYLIGSATGFLALVFLYGAFETGTKAKRDEKGKRID